MKRKIISTLFALVLVFTLGLVTAVPTGATPAPAAVSFDTSGGSVTAEWSTAKAGETGAMGAYSVELHAGFAGDDWAEVVLTPPAGITLDDMATITSGWSWWYFIATADFGNRGTQMELHFEGPGSGYAEMTIMYDAYGAFPANPPTLDAWTEQTIVSDNTTGLVFGTTEAGGAINEYPVGHEGTIADLVAYVIAQETVGDAGDWELTEVRPALGWIGASETIAYIDDVTIDGTLYELEPRVINTDTIEGFNTIQEAIDAASANDTIMVAAGTYVENVDVDKSLTLTGASSANVTVGAAGEDNVFDVTASDVTISGFTVNGANVEIYPHPVVEGFEIAGYAGIYLSPGVTDCNIHDNILTDNVYGILLLEAEDTVTAGNNTFTSNTATGNVISGIEMQHTYGNLFTSNTASSNGKYGITLDSSRNNIFTGNTANSNGREGFWLKQGQGVDGSSGNTFIDNTANLNTYSGVHMTNLCGDSTYTGNTFDSNGIAGMELGGTVDDATSNLTVNSNSFSGNPIGVKIDAGAIITSVVLRYNNIVGNTSYGVDNAGTGTIDAENNWWGTVNGPSHAGNTFNVGAQGDASSDDVDYCPWLDAAYATGASFAPVTSEDGDFSSIQAAIDAATSTTITCKAGTYDEDLYIDKSLTVQSEDGAITEEEKWEPVTELDGSVTIDLGLVGANATAETAVFDGFYIEEQENPIYLEEVDNGSSLTISNNVLYGYIFGIMSGSPTVDNASSVTIEGNYIFDGEAYGIYFEEIIGGSEVTIRDNEIFWNSTGIFIDYLEEESTLAIEDNLVAENNYGIEFYDVDESTVIIAGNTIGEANSEFFGELAGNYYVGIYFSDDTVSDSTILIGGDTPEEGNVIVGNGLDEGGYGGIYVEYLEGSSLDILNNEILNNYYDGVYVGYFDEYSTVDIHYNSIAGNNYGVSYGSPYLIDATCNWWGDVAGPYHWTNPYSGTDGDEVSDDVDYIPWLIQNELAEDWNIWSVPIAPDAASWAQMQADLVEAGVISIYYFDSATQLWGADADDAGPLDAFYIKMPDDTRIRYCISSDATFPGQKAMKVGWNLIGLAELHYMHVDEAVLDAYWGTGVAGNLTGYSKVISPSLNGVYWIWQRGGAETPDMYPTRGYWVFMVNDGTLGGFTLTPIVEEEMGP